MKAKYVLLTGMLFVTVLALSGCVPGDGTNNVAHPAGFFWGIWHGWIAPISLIIGIFKPNIRVYEALNTGWWYDTGFYIAVICGFGGISFRRRKKGKRD
ncbi:hypothetical protein [Paenibacillus sp. CF384]|uniref:hypothetical protein n=1 Tax=Paenibacillus sp. CF384 TaxID=1884382 RepID=UPI000896A32E|nr:hypothetical protein [Paenibacillus sp. CF384]SDW15256.1 hypothetical protein SAMN05518855_1001440 [Paenibacillus sp. CF384]